MKKSDNFIGSIFILLVEDEMVYRLISTVALEKEGFRVMSAPDGVAALKAMKEEDFDLILMDVYMPEMDGFETTRMIRSDRSGDFDPQIPVIAMTGADDVGSMEEALRSGMDDIILKPFEISGLIRMIRKYLKEKGTKPEAVTIEQDLLDQVKGDSDLYRQLVRILTGRIPELIDEIATALDQDPLRVIGLAHTLKGTSAMFRLHGIKETARALELSAKESDVTRMRIHLAEIRSRFDEIKGSLEKSSTGI